MATKAELESRLSQCKTAVDFASIAIEASKEPADIDFAKEMIAKAEGMCMLPFDFIKLAEAYVYCLDDKDKANELYEEAGENCFEAIESAELGHSIFVIFNDKERAAEHLTTAAKEAKKASELLTISSYVLSDLGDEALANDLIAKVEADLKTYDDFVKTTDLLISQGNTDAAKTLFAKAGKKVDGVANNVKYAGDVREKFNDKDRALDILNSVVDDAQFTNEFVALAEEFNQWGDKEKCEELIQQGQDFAMQGDEHISLAIAYLNIMNDKDKARSSFEKGIKDIGDKNKLMEYAELISNQMQDKELALKFYAQAENKATGFKDYLAIAAHVKTTINDTEYIDKLYMLAEGKAESFDDLKTLGADIHANLNNNDKALGVYRKAMASIQKFPQYFELLDESQAKLNSKDFAEEILRTALDKAQTSTELLQICDKVISILDDKEHAKTILDSAEETVTSLAELKSVNDAVTKYFPDDLERLARIKEKLAKREENQALYEEFQTKEFNASTFSALIKLNSEMMGVLNDKYYSKKLLTAAENMLKNEFFNIEKYQTLLEQIGIFQDNEGWLTDILNFVFKERVKFFFELDAVCRTAMKVISDKQKAAHLCVKFCDEYLIRLDNSKIKNANEYVKLAILRYELSHDVEKSNGILRQSEELATTDTAALVRVAATYSKLNGKESALRISEIAVKKSETAEQLVNVIKYLVQEGFDKQFCKSLYMANKPNTKSISELSGWIVGIIDLFNDTELADKEYKTAISNLKGSDRDLMETSRNAAILKSIF